jgi:hypothetical protein
MMSLRNRPGQLNQSVSPFIKTRFLRRWIEEQTSMAGLPTNRPRGFSNSRPYAICVIITRMPQ